MKPIRNLFILSLFFLFFLAILTLSSSNRKNDPVVHAPFLSKQETKTIDFIHPLAGCDELGRILPGHEEVGGIRGNRNVGIFYFLWQGDNASKISEQKWDLSKIIPYHPEVLEKGDHEN